MKQAPVMECLFSTPHLRSMRWGFLHSFFCALARASRFENATPELVRDARCTPMLTPTRRLTDATIQSCGRGAPV
jgi:hypothetical protein